MDILNPKPPCMDASEREPSDYRVTFKKCGSKIHDVRAEEIKRDHVNHPSHYNSHPSGIECIEIARHYDFAIGNAIKYLWRAGLKDDPAQPPVDKQIEDLKKAVWYINDKLESLTGIKHNQ